MTHLTYEWLCSVSAWAAVGFTICLIREIWRLKNKS